MEVENAFNLHEYYDSVSEFKRIEYEKILSSIINNELNVNNSSFNVWTKFLIESKDFDDLSVYYQHRVIK